MYPAELWVSDIDGNNKIKIASTQGTFSTGDSSPDSTQLTYSNTARDADENFVVNADGSHLLQLPHSLGNSESITWTRTGKDLFITGNQHWQNPFPLQTWRLSPDVPRAEPFSEGCGFVMDSSPDARYLLTSMMYGDNLGIFELSRRQEVHLACAQSRDIPAPVQQRWEVSTLHRFDARRSDPVSPVLGRRQGCWTPQTVLKLPFAFAQRYGGNAYDIARDLSKIVYARPGGQFDFYSLLAEHSGQ